MPIKQLSEVNQFLFDYYLAVPNTPAVRKLLREHDYVCAFNAIPMTDYPYICIRPNATLIGLPTHRDSVFINIEEGAHVWAILPYIKLDSPALMAVLKDLGYKW